MKNKNMFFKTLGLVLTVLGFGITFAKGYVDGEVEKNEMKTMIEEEVQKALEKKEEV